MRQVLMMGPHYPADTSAGTHLAHPLAPHLSKHSRERTISARCASGARWAAFQEGTARGHGD